MKVTTLIIGLIATLLLLASFNASTGACACAPSAEKDLWLSPVNTGDCVAPRISAEKTTFVAELDEKYCAENNPDEAKARKCIENSQAQNEFSFFTDRCSENEYFIGINGKEVRLRRTSKEPGKPHDFIGSFAGEGFTVEINNPRPVGDTALERDESNEDEVIVGTYEVDITVNNKTNKESFKGILSYGL